MTEPVVSKSAEGGFIKGITIKSNKGGETAGLDGGFLKMFYRESIMQDTVSIDLAFMDTGSTVNKKSVVDGLPVVGGESVSIKFEDNNKNILEFGEKKNNFLYVNKLTPLVENSKKSGYMLSLTSKEYILNEKIRLPERFDGKISETVKTILTAGNFLGLDTKKNIDDIEESANTYNFVGNNKKPLYTINWLSKKAIPADTKGKKSAGFFFYETYTGYHFRSIEGLLKQDEKKRIVYNETTDSRSVPKNYDVKAADYQRDSRLDVREKFKIGTYKTRLVTFDPFTTFYKVDKVSPDDLSTGEAAKSLPTMNPEFESPDANREFSRTLYSILDTGTLPTGDSNTQIKKSGEEISYPSKHSLPSIMRYNQLFTSQVTITIPGDFSLHAGDAIFLDMAELVDNTSDKVNSEQGGLYIISDLCHYISPDKTYTKMNLVRDAYGRKAKSRN